PMTVMHGDGAAQLGNAEHRGILIPAVDRRLGGLAAHVLGTGIVGKALAEIDGVVLARERRHHLEHRDRQIGEDRIHESVGGPAAFRVLRPPARWAWYGSPADCAASDAVTERLPERQANTTCRPPGSGSSPGSNRDMGR